MSGGMPHGLMIADDLTGALDSSVAFAERGWQVRVLDWRSASASWFESAGGRPVLLVVDTASRGLAPGTAAARIARLLAKLSPLPAGTFVFKKIDSRLKGNVVSETAAVAAGVGRTRILFCPAVPDAGRLVEGGLLKEQGRETALPRLPVVFDVGYPDVRSLTELRGVALAFSPGDGVAVGARGLADSLAEAMSPLPHRRDAVASLRAPVRFVIGTNDPVTLAQLQELRSSTDIAECTYPNERLPAPSSSRHMVLQFVASSAAEFQQRLPAFVEWAAPAVAEAGTVVVSGGDTLRALADLMGWAALKPVRSLGQGAVLATPSTGGGPLIVSKSGGFGHPAAFSRLLAQAVPKAET